VQGRAPTKRDGARKKSVPEEVDYGSTNDEVLLDLRV